jgi:hypothetical protein
MDMCFKNMFKIKINNEKTKNNNIICLATLNGGTSASMYAYGVPHTEVSQIQNLVAQLQKSINGCLR